MRWFTQLLWLFALGLLVTGAALAQLTLPAIGGFEGSLPSYWGIASQPSGTQLMWATDAWRSLGHSLKITKPAATADSAAWISGNMCDIWSPQHLKNVDILLGAYVMTQGVNTNPTTQDQMWYIAYDFWDSAGAFIGETMLPINQSVASSGGFVADTNVSGQTILPKDSWTTIVKFVAGKNATGTVWADDFVFYGRAGAWAGQDWNTGVGVPTGWNYWLPPTGGNDGLLNDGFENTVITNEAAHSGSYSLKFYLPYGRQVHDAWVGTRRIALNDLGAGTIHEGDQIRISMWIKASGLVPDSEAANPGSWSVGVTPIFHTGLGNNDPYDEIGAHDDVFTFPHLTQFDWTKYSVVVTVPVGQGIRSLSIRPHVYAKMTGTIYYDDITVQKVTSPLLADIGGFESSLPSYWTIGSQPSGATLNWATDQSRSMGHSLKIAKPSATADSAAWISGNMCDIWSPQHLKNVDILLGAYVMTQGVNTNPTTQDQMWYIAYDFWDSAGAFIGETMLPINQSVASSGGFVADTNVSGQTILPKDSWTTIVKFVAGKNATGTVWADDFVFYGRAGAWAGQDWNTGVGVPTGWNYWLPPTGGNDGLLNDGFENTVITNEAAHSGSYSLKFYLPYGRQVHDAWVGTRRIPLTDLIPGVAVAERDTLQISMWLKGRGLVPDSEAANPGSWSVGLTPIFHSGAGNNDPYDEIGAHDYTWVFPPDTAFDWTQFSLKVGVPLGQNAHAISIRPHVYAKMTGTIYWDDLTVTDLGGPTVSVASNAGNLPKRFELLQNYPNPFNPSTNIRYEVPTASHISLVVYNVLGQVVRTLVEEELQPGRYEVTWDGRNDRGMSVGSGMYLYRFSAGEYSIVHKMLLLK